MIIAIDGPAGAGKSTIARMIAQKLSFLYIDTGAIYRALTLKVLEKKIDLNHSSAIVDTAATSAIDLVNNQDGSLKVFLDSRDVSQEIRQARVTRFVSDIAKIKEVRHILIKLQRRLGEERDSVLDGRDIGTVVFPDADKKFYLDAKFEERVMRRYKELKALGENITFEDIAGDLRNRDTIDSTRQCAPLKKADDAIYIDTTDMSIDEVVEKVLKHILAQNSKRKT
jgi:cytidylate kinase